MVLIFIPTKRISAEASNSLIIACSDIFSNNFRRNTVKQFKFTFSFHNWTTTISLFFFKTVNNKMSTLCQKVTSVFTLIFVRGPMKNNKHFKKQLHHSNLVLTNILMYINILLVFYLFLLMCKKKSFIRLFLL